jgi:hypothetical protein
MRQFSGPSLCPPAHTGRSADRKTKATLKIVENNIAFRSMCAGDNGSGADFVVF